MMSSPRRRQIQERHGDMNGTVWDSCDKVPALWLYHVILLEHYFTGPVGLVEDGTKYRWDGVYELLGRLKSVFRGGKHATSKEHCNAWSTVVAYAQSPPKQPSGDARAPSRERALTIDSTVILGTELMPPHISPVLNVNLIGHRAHGMNVSDECCYQLGQIQTSWNSRVIRRFGWYRFVTVSFNRKNVTETQLRRVTELGISLGGLNFKYFHGKYGEDSALFFAEVFPGETNIPVRLVWEWHLQLECPRNKGMIAPVQYSRLDLLSSKTIPSATVRSQAVQDGDGLDMNVQDDRIGPAPDFSVMTDGAASISPSALNTVWRQVNYSSAHERLWRCLCSFVVAAACKGYEDEPDYWPCCECVIDELTGSLSQDTDKRCTVHVSVSSEVWKRTVKKCIQMGAMGPPAAVQGRLGGCKGVWFSDPLSPQNQVSVRPSMEKICMWPHEEQNSRYHFPTDRSQCQLEVLRYAKDSGPGFINPQLLLLLYGLGLRMATVESMLLEVRNILRRCQTSEDISNLLNLLYKNTSLQLDDTDDSHFSNVPDRTMELDYLWSQGLERISRFRETLGCLAQDVLSRIANRLHVPVSKSRRVILIPDPTGLLEPDEIFINLSGKTFRFESENQCIRGENIGILESRKVLLARNPSYDPMDIRLFRAVTLIEKFDAKNPSNLDLKNVAKCETLQDVAILPVTGNVRSATLLAGGDYDGDTAWACWDERIIEEVDTGISPINTSRESGESSNSSSKDDRLAVAPTYQQIYLKSLGDTTLGVASNQHMEILDYFIGLFYWYHSSSDKSSLIEDFIPGNLFAKVGDLLERGESVPKWAFQQEVRYLAEVCKSTVDSRKHANNAYVDPRIQKSIDNILECKRRLSQVTWSDELFPLSRLKNLATRSVEWDYSKTLESFSSKREGVTWKQLCSEALKLVQGYNEEISRAYCRNEMVNKSQFFLGVKLRWRDKYLSTLGRIANVQNWTLEYCNLQLGIACWQISTQEVTALSRGKPFSFPWDVIYFTTCKIMKLWLQKRGRRDGRQSKASG